MKSTGRGKVNILLGVTGFPLAASLPMALGCLQPNTLGKKGSPRAIRRTQEAMDISQEDRLAPAESLTEQVPVNLTFLDKAWP